MRIADCKLEDKKRSGFTNPQSAIRIPQLETIRILQSTIPCGLSPAMPPDLLLAETQE
jgi:hypothetical protein